GMNDVTSLYHQRREQCTTGSAGDGVIAVIHELLVYELRGKADAMSASLLFYTLSTSTTASALDAPLFKGYSMFSITCTNWTPTNAITGRLLFGVNEAISDVGGICSTVSGISSLFADCVTYRPLSKSISRAMTTSRA